MITLRQHREDTLCETLDIVSKRSGFSKMNLSKIERGEHSPRKTNFKKLAKGYRLSVEEFRQLVKHSCS